MSTATRTAVHRPSTRRRHFRHDDLIAVDLFSGFGGLTQGIEKAGFTTIMAANHNAYKVEIHEANHPHAEHWIADLVNKESSDYHSARDLPAADLLVAGVSCVNHSQANTQKAYAQGLSLFDLDDPDFEDRVTRSERDRATANCVLHYAERHHPRMILIECTTELTSWGPAVRGKPKLGDGTTYRWWLQQFEKLGYKHRVLYLNSMFFGVPQSRDRLYIAFWDKRMQAPDLEHRPKSWCGHCDTLVQAVWSWKTGVPPSGSVRYGKQYNYRCPSCRSEVIPSFTPSLHALDLGDLGTRIGDRKKPLAASTMARAQRCKDRFAEFPAVLMPFTRRGTDASSGRHLGQPMQTQTAQQETALLSAMLMPAKAVRGAEKHLGQPLGTQTSQQEAALLSTGAIMNMANPCEAPGSNCRTRDLAQPLWTQLSSNTQGVFRPPVALAIDNFQGAARGADEPLPTQGGSETMAVVSSGVLPYRKNTTPTTHAEAMPTVTAEQIPGILTAAGTIKNNGSNGDQTAPHPTSDPLGTLTSRDTTAIVSGEWREALAELKLEDCFFRMMRDYEIGRGCGFDVDFGDYQGTFKVWGSARDQVDGFGNAVSPQVGEWIGGRLRAALHSATSA
ncbi:MULTISPECIES: DNA cytosine methyltransferase [Arthrobacter]|uniref:DNA (cytosine-5-)-methyltransferase n=1 Tax=Arthrobacter terricola TaxID=2547396 RepID=A0A4R5K8D4_9MICC|nr:MULTISPECIES: DNA cytosine methyltransferase [Arthrobacter]MBT8163069.1 DNA cytosine methyltransferase [Arthrobacter sp. GN70]TDF88109.1 DNA cytosine methyltransferase [Arthrobacter terricola]